jgi:hypothetical protein
MSLKPTRWVQLEELKQQQLRLNQEKVDLENQLEAEQEYIVNKLQKQVDGLAKEKAHLQQEKADLRRHVSNPSPTPRPPPFSSGLEPSGESIVRLQLQASTR